MYGYKFSQNAVKLSLPLELIWGPHDTHRCAGFWTALL
jgi:hypothetical protein